MLTERHMQTAFLQIAFALRQIKIAANKCDMPYQSLIKM